MSSMPRLRSALGGASIAALVLAAVTACGERRGARAAPAYVGRQTCAGCHEVQEELWTGSHHDRAMQPASEATVLGDFDGASYSHFGAPTTFARRDGRFFVTTAGRDGELAEFEIAFTFGVEPLQQYLVRLPGGRLQALSVAWDTRPPEHGGGRWFHLYPDEAIPPGDLLHWTGPFQNWNYMCADCHSTNVARGYDTETDSYSTTWSEIDVACEACHGPGSRHVEWARALAQGVEPGLRPDEGPAGLVNDLKDRDGGRWAIDRETGDGVRTPARSSRAEIETCAPCHSRRTAIASAHTPGASLYDGYRPALLEEQLYFDDGQILDEVYVYGSFAQSRMYVAGVTCGDCHEPHGLGLRFQGNSLCAQCHDAFEYDTPDHHHHASGGPGASCVECHMPARTYMVVDDRRDHSLRIPRPDLGPLLGTPNACNGCHADRSARWAADAIAGWGAARAGEPHYGEVLHAARAGRPGSQSRLAGLAGDPGQAPIVRATALSLLADFSRAEVAAALRAGLADESPAVRTGALSALTALQPAERLALAWPLLADPLRAVRIEAARQLAAVPAGALPPDEERRLEEALAEYRAAQLVNADRAEFQLNLGVVAAERREFDAAESAYRRAIRLEPRLLQPYLNLADLFREQGREKDVRTMLDAALAVDPADAFAHHALGLHLVRAGDRAGALGELRRASELAPDVTRFAYVWAVCLSDMGEKAAAVAVLERARERAPGDRDLLVALATTWRDLGSLDEALGYARELLELAPSDRSARVLVDELERAAAAEAGGGARRPR